MWFLIKYSATLQSKPISGTENKSAKWTIFALFGWKNIETCLIDTANIKPQINDREIKHEISYKHNITLHYVSKDLCK